jgi:hypothetical protein
MSREKGGNRHENLVGIGLVDPGVGPKSRSVGTRRTVKRRARLQSGHDRLHHRSRGVCEDAPSPEVIYFSLGALGSTVSGRQRKLAIFVSSRFNVACSSLKASARHTLSLVLLAPGDTPGPLLSSGVTAQVRRSDHLRHEGEASRFR